MAISNLVKYVIGAKDTAKKGVPIDVQLSLDKDMKDTIIKSSVIIGSLLMVGIGAGVYIANKNK